MNIQPLEEFPREPLVKYTPFPVRIAVMNGANLTHYGDGTAIHSAVWGKGFRLNVTVGKRRMVFFLTRVLSSGMSAFVSIRKEKGREVTYVIAR